MKNLFIIIVVGLLFTSCRRIKGNGVLSSETRNISTAERIKLAGSYDVELIPGTTTSVKVEADENLLPYIITENRDGMLVIKTKDRMSISTKNKMTIYITTPHIEEVTLAGSGNIIGKGKFSGSDRLKISIAGSGDANLEVNTPKVEATIAGTGNIQLAGETQDEKVSIAGNGDFKASDLKAENADVHIAGSGDVSLFADAKLNINIAGSGSVKYRGNPSITQKIAGSGDVKKED